MTYRSRGRSIFEVILAIIFVGFLVGFITVLCIGNYFRAKRAQERQRQRRLGKLAASGNISSSARGGGGGGGSTSASHYAGSVSGTTYSESQLPYEGSSVGPTSNSQIGAYEAPLPTPVSQGVRA